MYNILCKRKQVKIAPLLIQVFGWSWFWTCFK